MEDGIGFKKGSGKRNADGQSFPTLQLLELQDDVASGTRAGAENETWGVNKS